MRIFVATANPGKLSEYSAFLSGLGCEVSSLRDLKGSPDIEETGTTFEENALIKAKKGFELTGLPTIGDDGGFEIEALGDEPGVKSHRWLDGVTEASDEELVDYTLERLDGEENRRARLRLVMALYDGSEAKYAEASIDGVVMREKPASIPPGFPYRALLFVTEFGKLYDELTEEEHDRGNHRRRALQELAPHIEELKQ